MPSCPNNILKARERAGMSQKEVSITLNVKAPSISGWENKKNYPTAENLKQLSALFCVSTDYLLGLSDEPQLGASPSNRWDGSMLAELREDRGESAIQVADAIGVSEALYNSYERGLSEPTITHLELLADHFCVDVDIILKRYFHMVENEKIVTGTFHVTKEEQTLIELYRQASEDDKTIILCALNKYRKNSPSASADKAM